MYNQTDDRVQALNGDQVVIKMWYRRPTGVDIWAFGDLDDLVEVELDTKVVQITAVKHLSWKKLSNGQVLRARVLKNAEQMLCIIRDSDALRAYVNSAIAASQRLTQADAEHTAEALANCRDSLIEMTERAEDRRKTIDHLNAQTAKLKVKAQYKDAQYKYEPDSEIAWLRSVVEKALADRL